MRSLCSFFILLSLFHLFASEEADEIVPFTINVSDELLKDLRRRLSDIRPPRVVAGQGWGRGTNIDYLLSLAEYWRDEFDWRKVEAKLNSVLPQFTTHIDGLKVHFAHIPSSNSSAIPLIFIHGWPGSFFEAIEVVDLWTSRFHIVVPSLPGYGFSDLPENGGMNPRTTAALFSRLMRKIGYDHFIVQGGDWGSLIGAYIAQDDPKGCLGYHANMIPSFSSLMGKGSFATIRTALAYLFPSLFYEAGEDPGKRFLAVFPELGYFAEQATKPHTLSVGLSDSPFGLLAWIVEKFYVWGDIKNGNIESQFSKDTLLTNVMLYWITNSIGSSVQMYYEFAHSPLVMKFEHQLLTVSVPSGFALFPAELFNQPRSDVEYFFTSICRWTKFPSGGHFAALEEPNYLASDLIRFSEECIQYPKTTEKNEL